MAKREELYRQFGPMLLEAVCRVIKDEINILRIKEGLPKRTNQQVMDIIDNQLKMLTRYDWMER